MLFIGTITRLIEGDRYKHNHEPVAYPVVVGVSKPPRDVRCSCRGGVLCSEDSARSRDVRVVAPIVAVSHHDTRRQWRYERRAMRDYHRAARHGYGYGYGQPIAIPGAGQGSYAPDDYEVGSSASRALPDHRRDQDWEDDWPAARAATGASRIQKVQNEAPPPRYETVSRDPDPRRTSMGVLTEVKGT